MAVAIWSGCTASACSVSLCCSRADVFLSNALSSFVQAKGLSQKDFAAKLMIPAKTIQEYESGKAIPQNGLIAKMERALGCKLPRNSK